jgi:hypothetical protein
MDETLKGVLTIMTVRRIISGGQTGADHGGLAAAKILGLETGGSMPKGWRTAAGRDYSRHLEYGLTENPSSEYPPRTRDNVVNSDGTIVFGDTNSPGSKLTIRLCKEVPKPWIVITNWDLCEEENLPATLSAFRYWINEKNIQVLNVAGNRESTNPGIFEKTKSFLIKALKEDK